MTTKPRAIKRIDLPEMQEEIGLSVRDAERELERAVPGRTPVLDLTYANTHRFEPPNWTIDTFVGAATKTGMTYTPYRGDKDVRDAVVDNIREVLDFPISEDSTAILTPGTQGALFIALASVLEAGDTVLLPDPEYLSTERMLRYFDVNVVRIPIVYKGGKVRPTLDIEALNAAAKLKPKLFVFSHPNNPTGLIYDDETLQVIADQAKEHDFYVLADQLYCRLVYENEKFTHIASLEGMEERTITLLGPSKTESLSGYRLGVAVAPNFLIDRMEDVQAMTALRAPAYAQHILARWLKDDQEFLSQRIKEYENLRDITLEKLNNSGVFEVENSWGSAYVFAKYNANVSDRELTVALKEREGIVVNPGYQFGPQGIGHIRICFAQDETIWEDALDRIINVVKSFQ